MLFTGKGDGGSTKVFDSPSGVRVSKASELPEALGTLDELNSFVGLAKAHARKRGNFAIMIGTDVLTYTETLHEVQEALFIVQAEAAGADKHLTPERVKRVEEMVNAIEQIIPPIKSFSIAGGTELSATLDVARTLARRAERRLVGLHEAKIREFNEHTRAYMNRLSSLLFALARLANHRAGIPEENPSYK